MFIGRKIGLNIVLLLAGAAAALASEFNWQGRIEPADNGLYRVTAECHVAENSYLDAEMTAVSAVTNDGRIVPLTAQSLPQDGKYTGGVHRWSVQLPEKVRQIQADFQGCVGETCLMPESKIITFTQESTAGAPPSPVAEESSQLPPELAAALAEYSEAKSVSGLLTEAELVAFLQGSPAETVENSAPDMDFLPILLLVLLGGMGLNLTPCVLPMIPINLAIIGASGSNTSRWQGFRRGGAYALGITLAYGVLGVLAAVSSSFGTLNSSSIFNWAIALIFILLGLGMFGVYELDLSRFSRFFKYKSAHKLKLPPEVSAFGMGIVAALLAGACVAPVVITVVLLAAKLYSEGHSWGLFLPFALGLSMALPWPLLGAGLSVLPKPGAWMVRVKQLFGALIFGMALYYGYLGWSLRSGAVDQQEITGNFTAELQEAAAADETVLIDCWATWCKNCSELEKRLESDAVQTVIEKENIRVIKFQAEKSSDPTVKAFMQKYDLRGLPSLVLLKKGQ